MLFWHFELIYMYTLLRYMISHWFSCCLESQEIRCKNVNLPRVWAPGRWTSAEMFELINRLFFSKLWIRMLPSLTVTYGPRCLVSGESFRLPSCVHVVCSLKFQWAVRLEQESDRQNVCSNHKLLLLSKFYKNMILSICTYISSFRKIAWRYRCY